MAEFRNPIRTATSGQVPIGATEAADISGTVAGVIDFAEGQAIRSARGRLSEQIESQARDFIAQPARANILTETERELEQAQAEREDPVKGNQTRKRLRNDMRKLRRAMDTGAMSSTEVRARADALTRRAIADTPGMAGDLIEERNNTLGLFGAELQQTDARLDSLRPESDELPGVLREQVFKQMNQDLVDAGFAVPSGNLQTIQQLWVDNIAGPRWFEANLEHARRQGELTKLEAQQAAPKVAQATAGRVVTKIRSVLNNQELTEGEKVQEIEAIRLTERQRLTENLNILSTEEVNRRWEPIQEAIDANIQAVLGEFDATAASNKLDALVDNTALEAARTSESALGMVVLRRLGGDQVLTQINSLQFGGIEQTAADLKRVLTGAVRGSESDLSPEDIRTGDNEVDAFRIYYEGIRDSVQDGTVSREDGERAFRNVMRALLPSSDKEITEIPLDKWNAALDAMAKPQFREMIESLDLSASDTRKFQQRIIDYNTQVLEPNITRALLEQVDMGEQVFAEGTDTRVPLVSFITPDFNETNTGRRGHITFTVREDRMNQLGGLARNRIRDRVENLNRTYAKRWNQSLTVNSNLTGEDPLRASISRWNDRFAGGSE